MELSKKLQRRGTGCLFETELERAYTENIIEQMKVQLFTLEEEGVSRIVFKLMVELKDDNNWYALAARRIPDQPRDFRDYNTIIKHIHTRYPNTENVQIVFKPEEN